MQRKGGEGERRVRIPSCSGERLLGGGGDHLNQGPFLKRLRESMEQIGSGQREV